MTATHEGPGVGKKQETAYVGHSTPSDLRVPQSNHPERRSWAPDKRKGSKAGVGVGIAAAATAVVLAVTGALGAKKPSKEGSAADPGNPGSTGNELVLEYDISPNKNPRELVLNNPEALGAIAKILGVTPESLAAQPCPEVAGGSWEPNSCWQDNTSLPGTRVAGWTSADGGTAVRVSIFGYNPGPVAGIDFNSNWADSYRDEPQPPTLVELWEDSSVDGSRRRAAYLQQLVLAGEVVGSGSLTILDENNGTGTNLDIRIGAPFPGGQVGGGTPELIELQTELGLAFR